MSGKSFDHTTDRPDGAKRGFALRGKPVISGRHGGHDIVLYAVATKSRQSQARESSEDKVQGHLDEPRTADRVLNLAQGPGRRAGVSAGGGNTGVES